jgi:glutamine amidotransferase
MSASAKADVVLLNSGGSNYTSLQAAFERLGASCQQSADPERIRAASHVVLPGVGSAESAMSAITAQHLAPLIASLKQPLLGICLGMQILYERSEESDINCLGLLPGKVQKLAPSPGIRIPHMGWNTIRNLSPHPLLQGLDGADFYFVHSYAAPSGSDTLAVCLHGQEFTAVVGHGNRMGVQFHPERSGEQGQQLLGNFLALSV